MSQSGQPGSRQGNHRLLHGGGGCPGDQEPAAPPLWHKQGRWRGLTIYTSIRGGNGGIGLNVIESLETLGREGPRMGVVGPLEVVLIVETYYRILAGKALQLKNPKTGLLSTKGRGLAGLHSAEQPLASKGGKQRRPGLPEEMRFS